MSQQAGVITNFAEEYQLKSENIGVSKILQQYKDPERLSAANINIIANPAA